MDNKDMTIRELCRWCRRGEFRSKDSDTQVEAGRNDIGRC